MSKPAGVKHVLCLYPFSDEVKAGIRALSPALDVTFSGPESQATVDALADPALDALLANYCPADLKKLPGLTWLGMVGAGVEHLRVADPWSHGVIVTNGSGLQMSAIGEYTMTALLLGTQKLRGRLENQAKHAWPSAWTEDWLGLLGSSLRNRTMTLVGYGSLGREIARLASAFGIRVLAIKARPGQRRDAGYSPPGLGDPEGTIPEAVGGVGEIHAFFARSDFAVLTLPWTTANDRLIDAAALAALPPHAVLINVARGKVLDESALFAALARGALGGAVLDVAPVEPVPTDSPMWGVPNLVITPHVSAINDPQEWWVRVAPLVIENLRRFADGRELLNATSGSSGY